METLVLLDMSMALGSDPFRDNCLCSFPLSSSALAAAAAADFLANNDEREEHSLWCKPDAASEDE